MDISNEDPIDQIIYELNQNIEALKDIGGSGDLSQKLKAARVLINIGQDDAAYSVCESITEESGTSPEKAEAQFLVVNHLKRKNVAIRGGGVC